MQCYRSSLLPYLSPIILIIFTLSACGGGSSEEETKNTVTEAITCQGDASQAPVVLTVGTACAQTSGGNSVNNGRNFFAFESTTTGEYTISITDVNPSSANLDWALYTDSDYENNLTICAHTSSGDQTCTATLGTSVMYYLIVENMDANTVNFSILLTAP